MIPLPTPTLFLFPQSGGGSVPPMKVVTAGASRLKAAQGQAGSPDKGKHGKQRAEYMRIQAQQQVGVGTAAPPPPTMCSCCVRAISCPYSVFRGPPSLQLPRESLPARTAPLVLRAVFSLLSQSQCSGSGLEHKFSARPLPSGGPSLRAERALPPLLPEEGEQGDSCLHQPQCLGPLSSRPWGVEGALIDLAWQPWLLGRRDLQIAVCCNLLRKRPKV